MPINKLGLKQAFLDSLNGRCGKRPADATPLQHCQALVAVVKNLIGPKWDEAQRGAGRKRVYYLSMEFLPGRLLKENLINLGIRDMCQEVLAELGVDLLEAEESEPEPGLGSGGLGRLAASYLEALASVNVPAVGCSLRYKRGYFMQEIVDGYQREEPDEWAEQGDLWGRRALKEEPVTVRFGSEEVKAVAYYVPVTGYGCNTVNCLHLWETENSSDPICQALYPDDSSLEGKRLRLKQEYFLVSASLQSIVRSYKGSVKRVRCLPQQVAVHINDTHPALAIPELMRILMDEAGLGWDEAWDITSKTVSFTNHTTLPEALEKWSVDLFQSLLPRIYSIVLEINERFCRDLWNKYPGEWDRIASMAVVAYGEVRVAHLAVVGSYSVNGVSQLHTGILRQQIMKEFWEHCPSKFNNKTNGASHRRWILGANPPLASLLNKVIGPGWAKNPMELRGLLRFQDDSSFLEELRNAKQINKQRLAEVIREKTGLEVNPYSLFDVQAKRIHGYKRQLLNVLHIMHLYNLLQDNPSMDFAPRTFIFSGKASPGYEEAKQTIRLINLVAAMINADQGVNDRLKVVFLQNYGVSLGEQLFAAADVSEQISLAGKEASGTGNMKSIMNGAVIVGTLDGATVEIRDEVGEGNIFTFGLTAPEVWELQQAGRYYSWHLYQENPALRRVLDQLVNGTLPACTGEFNTLHDALTNNRDRFFVLRDFPAYVETQRQVGQAWCDRQSWDRMSTVNIAHSGCFSSDLAVARYATDIWGLDACAFWRKP